MDTMRLRCTGGRSLKATPDRIDEASFRQPLCRSCRAARRALTPGDMMLDGGVIEVHLRVRRRRDLRPVLEALAGTSCEVLAVRPSPNHAGHGVCLWRNEWMTVGAAKTAARAQGGYTMRLIRNG